MNVRNEIVFNDAFAKTFMKMLKMAFPATVAIQIVETFSRLNEQQKNVFAVRDSLLERLADKDSSGKVKVANSNIVFKNKADEEEFISEMDKLLNSEFEIPLKEKIKLDDKIQISGEEILILKPVLDVNI
jgi:hypothetical protein